MGLRSECLESRLQHALAVHSRDAIAASFSAGLSITPSFRSRSMNKSMHMCTYT